MSNEEHYQRLSRGAIKQMLNGTRSEAAVLQVIYLADGKADESLPNESVSNTGQLNEGAASEVVGQSKYSRRLVLSDGTFAYPICSVRLDQAVDLYGLLKIFKYALNEIQSRKMIVLLEFKPLTAGAQIGQLLGDPTPFIPDGVPTRPANSPTYRFILQRKNLISQKGKTQFFKCCKNCAKNLANLQDGFYRCGQCGLETQTEFNYCLILSFCIGHPFNQVWLQTVHQESMKFFGPDTDLDQLYDLFANRTDDFEDLIRERLVNYNRGGVQAANGRPRQVICYSYRNDLLRNY